MSTSLRVLTGNLLRDRSDPVALGELLDRVDADLVVVQEMESAAAEVIRARYENHFLFPSIEYEGRGIATRLPAECGSLALPWRPGTWARIDLGRRRLLAAGLHMPNPIDFPWWRSVRERSDQLQELFRWADVEVDDAFILAGDMNASPAWPLYRQLTKRWDDLVFSAAERSGERPELTWAWRSGLPRMLRIDHVFGQGVEAVAARVETIQGSDHDAVVVDLVLA